MNVKLLLSTDDVGRFQSDFFRLHAALDSVIMGQPALITELLNAFLSGGHVLLESVPGLGKTHLIKALSRALGLPLARIQCTPDLMPADITGTEVLSESRDGRGQHLAFRPGPIFAPLVLVDEINRATPRSQAALLEAMQEGQVTYAGEAHALPIPFWVVATQNPIELQGTYPLPEAQVDRFLVKLNVEYPAADALVAMAQRTLDSEPADHVDMVLSRRRVDEMMAQTREVVISEPVSRAAAELVLATQPGSDMSHPLARKHFSYGASPRALQALLRTARVRALTDGRGHVSLHDVAAGALVCLRHRLLLRVESELHEVAVDGLIAEMLAEWTSEQ